jgi:hypothetical protein
MGSDMNKISKDCIVFEARRSALTIFHNGKPAGGIIGPAAERQFLKLLFKNFKIIIK